MKDDEQVDGKKISVYSLRRDIQSLHQFYIVFSISIQKNPSRKTQSPYFPYFTHFFSIGLLENIEVSKGNGGTLL